MKPHVAEADRIQREIIRKMTPAQKFAIAGELYKTAWEIKKCGLRSLHPDWTETALEARTRRVFVTGYAGD